MNYVYDAVIEREEDGYAVSFPQFPEAVIFGATREQAADDLGVTAGRVSQLASAGRLQAVTFGRKKMVTIASVNARKANPPVANRPRKLTMS